MSTYTIPELKASPRAAQNEAYLVNNNLFNFFYIS